MILLLGSTGYLGQAFATELRQRGLPFIPLTRRAIDYTQFEVLFDYVRKTKPDFLINAAGCASRSEMHLVAPDRLEVVVANTILPQTVAQVCNITQVPWGHISCGSIYAGAKLLMDGELRVQRDLDSPEMQRLFAANPERFHGFTEYDEPNCSFRQAPCNFISGTKALAEERLREYANLYVWRAGQVFDDSEGPRNYLWRVQHDENVREEVNSLSHRGEFVRACLDLWARSAPFGIYNVVNPGAVTTRQVVETIERVLRPDCPLQFGSAEEQNGFATAPPVEASCVLDGSKLRLAGIKLTPARRALEDVLTEWRSIAQPPRRLATLQNC